MDLPKMQSEVYDLIKKSKDGLTAVDMIDPLGWKVQQVRDAMRGLRERKLIALSKRVGSVRFYIDSDRAPEFPKVENKDIRRKTKGMTERQKRVLYSEARKMSDEAIRKENDAVTKKVLDYAKNIGAPFGVLVAQLSVEVASE